MEKQVEFTGKKVQDAVNEGLASLGITLDDAEIKILSNGGLFKKAKVLICYDDGLKEGEKPASATVKENPASAPKTVQQQEKKEYKSEKKKELRSERQTSPDDEPRWGSAPIKREPTTTSNFGKSQNKPPKRESALELSEQSEDVAAENAEQSEEKRYRKKQNRESVLPTEEQLSLAKEFVTEMLSLMKIEGSVEIAVNEGMRVNLETEDARVIGHRGEVLDSMQQLISSIINNTHGKFVHVTVDGLGYRDRRKETLEGLARRMADKAVRIRRKVSLDAMNSADRRIVHAALGEREDVFTRSEGHEPARRVVIVPKRR